MFLTPTPESLSAVIERSISGPVVMLNLLRFRKFADYRESPGLAPSEPISGRQAYEIYVEHTIPLVAKVGGTQIFVGTGGSFLVGPRDEVWDKVLLIRYPSLEAFSAMIKSSEYGATAGHRTAALADSRLLPIG